MGGEDPRNCEFARVGVAVLPVAEQEAQEALVKEIKQAEAARDAAKFSAEQEVISAEARRNAAEFAPDRITFHQGNLLEPISEPINLITANLPYVTDHEWTMLDDGVKLYEPQLALKGGPDGLDLIQELLNQATYKLRSGGSILLEIGWQQGQSTKNHQQKFKFESNFQTTPTTKKYSVYP